MGAPPNKKKINKQTNKQTNKNNDNDSSALLKADGKKLKYILLWDINSHRSSRLYVFTGYDTVLTNLADFTI